MAATATPVVVPADLLPPEQESPEERFARRIRAISLIRRRRRLAGLTLRQVGLAAMMPTDRVSRYEMGSQFPGPSVLHRLLEAIDRLEREGAGNSKRAEQARLEYEAEEVAL